MRGGQRAVAIELDQNLFQFAVHQVAGQAPDPKRGRALRTGWPPHHGTNHIIENAHQHIGYAATADGAPSKGSERGLARQFSSGLKSRRSDEAVTFYSLAA